VGDRWNRGEEIIRSRERHPAGKGGEELIGGNALRGKHDEPSAAKCRGRSVWLSVARGGNGKKV